VLTLDPYCAYRGSAEVLNTGVAAADTGSLRSQLFEGVPVRAGALAGHHSEDEAIKACLSRVFRMI
jgi:hypothetical protein